MQHQSTDKEAYALLINCIIQSDYAKLKDLIKAINGNPKEMLNHLPSFLDFPFISTDKSFDSDIFLQVFPDFAIAVSKSLQGILRNRIRYEQKNKSNNRPFTSLSELASQVIQAIWMRLVSIFNSMEDHRVKYITSIKTVSCICPVGGFLPEPELIRLVEEFCWRNVEVYPEHCFIIAARTIQCLSSNFLDSALAFKFLSLPIGHFNPTTLKDVWSFFRLIDYDDESYFYTALSFIPIGLEDYLIPSYVRIVDILLSQKENELLKCFLDLRIYGIFTKKLDKDFHSQILSCILRLLGKFDFEGNHINIIQYVARHIDEVGEVCHQILGTLISSDFPYPICASWMDKIARTLVQYPSVLTTKKLWALSNMFLNKKILVERSSAELVLTHTLDQSEDALNLSKDVPELSGLLRLSSIILSDGRFLSINMSDRYFGFSRALYHDDPKVQWSFINGLNSILSAVGLYPAHHIEFVVEVFEMTPYYKVAIATSQFLADLFQRTEANKFRDRIKTAIPNQRFAIRDPYNEMHSQKLRQANSVLLQILD